MGMPNFVGNVPCRDLNLLLSYVWFYHGPNWPPTICTKFEVDTFSHCTNIKEICEIFGSSHSLGPRQLFSVWDFMIGFDKPHQPANFEVATFSRSRNIKGEPPILGNSPSSRPHELIPLCLILWWDLANPSCKPNLTSLASAVAKILNGDSKIFGEPS